MIKLLIKILSIFILTLVIISCDRVKNKTEQLTENIKEKSKKELEIQIQKVIDNVYPPFDSDKSDTDNNKQRFKEFIKIELTPDVKNIFCYDDAIGIDADYMFAFNCDPITSEKIIKVHNLTIDTINSDNGDGLQDNFEWWDKKQIKKLQKYSWTDGNQYFKYYWYDDKNKKAYFFDFDM